MSPGTDIQSKVNAAGSGTIFHLTAGVYRLQSITPKSGMQFIGDPGAILSGAKVLTGWTTSGATWVVGNQTQQNAATRGTCSSGYSGCIYPEDLFIDNVMLQHVTSLSQVNSNTWYFDYANNKIYIGRSPSGHTVETSVLPRAFTGTVPNVTIKGLIIEKYATIADEGAIYAQSGSNWIVDHNEIRFNHGGGVKMGPSMQLTYNNIHHNGLQGIAAYQIGYGLVENNTIAYNNTAHYDPYWSGGGTKFYSTNHFTIRGNNVNHNYGKGLWADHENIYMVYENNIVTDNEHQGISHEISYDAVIRNNTVLRNGFKNVGGLAGAGIGVSCSSNVEIYGNTVSGNAHGIVGRQLDRGAGSQGMYLTKNMYVHDNIVTMTTGQNGLLQSVGDNSIYTSRNNRFIHNTYTLNGLSTPFYWMNGGRSKTTWTGTYSQDVTGIFH